jgi:CBS domain containing-hemolysin-like protein
MELPSGIGLTSVLVLVLANGFFVAAEFAIVGVRRSRLEQLAGEGHRTARAARDVVDHMDAYIAACQLGITMSSLALGWIGEPALAHLLEPPLQRLAGAAGVAAADKVAVGVAFAVITALHIVIGELAPKGMALQYAEGTTLFVTRPLRLFYRVFRAPIVVLNAVGNGVLRLFGVRPAQGHAVHSAEELQLLVHASQQAGTVEPSEARIARRAFRFADLMAGELMTPRPDIEAVPLVVSWPELLARAESSRHDRLPVYGRSVDDIVGLLHLRDLFGVVSHPEDPFDLKALLHPCPAFPRTKRADALLEEMRAAGEAMAIVVDEYGGTAGLITLDDIMSALVGRSAEEGVHPALGTPQPDGSRLFDGLTRLMEFEEATGVKVDEPEAEQVDTLGGLIMAKLGRLPRPGDVVAVGGRAMHVETVQNHRVRVLRMPRDPSEGAGPDHERA